MKFKECILHIGTEKTGTTSIQHSFFINQELLSKNDYFYPLSLGKENHTLLNAYACDDEKSGRQRKRALHKFNTTLKEFRKILPERMRAEFSGVTCSRLLLSNEHLHSRLTNLQEKRRLFKLLSEFAESIRIVVYLRRQDKLAVSFFNTKIISGNGDFDSVLPSLEKKIPYYFDYQTMLKEYALVFGQENIIVREFDKQKLKHGDVIEDIYNVIGFNDFPSIKKVDGQNQTITIEAQKFMSTLNKQIPHFIDSKPNPMRHGIQQMISEYPGEGRTVSRNMAVEFMTHFKEINLWIEQQFFDPEYDLFNDDFSSYPVEYKPCLDSDHLAKIGVNFFLAAQKEIYHEKAEVAYRDGLLKLKAENSNSKHHFLLALNYNPEHLGAHHQLSKIELDAGRLEEAYSLAQHAMQIDPKPLMGTLLLAQIQTQRNELEDAEKLFRKIIHTHTKSINAWIGLLDVISQQARKKEFKELSNQALKIFPDTPRLKLAIKKLRRRP